MSQNFSSIQERIQALGLNNETTANKLVGGVRPAPTNASTTTSTTTSTSTTDAVNPLPPIPTKQTTTAAAPQRSIGAPVANYSTSNVGHVGTVRRLPPPPVAARNTAASALSNPSSQNPPPLPQRQSMTLNVPTADYSRSSPNNSPRASDGSSAEPFSETTGETRRALPPPPTRTKPLPEPLTRTQSASGTKPMPPLPQKVHKISASTFPVASSFPSSPLPMPSGPPPAVPAKQGPKPYVPPADDDDDDENDEKKETEENKKKAPKIYIDPELEAHYTSKYTPEVIAQCEEAAVKLQTCYRKRMAVKTLEKMKQTIYHRSRCAQEILETEQAYVENLEVLVQVYLRRFQEEARKGGLGLRMADVTTIFSDVEVIVAFNKAFLEQLQARLQEQPESTPLGDVFLRMAPFFKTYTRYCNNFDKAINCVNRCKENPEFKEVLQRLDKDPRTNKLGIASYLITPVQRIPRYRLLLQDLKKHTHEDHPDYEQLDSALSKIMQVAKHLNATMKIIDNTNKILAIQGSFTEPLALLEAHRKFILEGALRLVTLDRTTNAISNSSDYYCHLFNDIILVSRKRDVRYELKNKVPIDHIILNDYYDAELDRLFQIVSTEVELVFEAPTWESKEEWLKAIYKARESHSKDRSTKVDVGTIRDDTTTTLASALSSEEEGIAIHPKDAIEQMKASSTMLKYCRNTKPHFRRFQITADEKFLTWGSPRKTTNESSIAWNEIKKVLIGQKTAIFQRYRNSDLDGLSFSLLYRDRTLDIVCKDKREFNTWVTGINYLMAGGTSATAASDPNFAHLLNTDDDSASTSYAAEVENTAVKDIDEQLDKEKKKLAKAFQSIGDAYSWGQGTRGALGHGNQEDQRVPLVIKDFLYLDVNEVICGNFATAIITTSGELFTWGAGDSGKLGHGDESDRPKPTRIKALQNVKIKQVALGSVHTIALDESGKVYVWGGNQYGQLGLCDDVSRNVPTLLETLENVNVVRVAAGPWHSAAITEDGLLYTWGRGEDATLGHGNTNNLNVPTFVSSLKDTPIAHVALGLWHSLALTKDGKVKAWGNNTYGQLGLGNEEQQQSPCDIETLKDKTVVQIAAGSSHSACITSDGCVWTWGNGIYGQIGNGDNKNSNVPVMVKRFAKVKAETICCGINHSMVHARNGKVYAWGAGTYGRLGIGNENDMREPTPIGLLDDKEVRKISCGTTHSACVCAHMWVPDKDASNCMDCNATFTFIRRRHHCRNCGGLFCDSCTRRRLPLLRFGYNDAVRVCENCYTILTKR